jgi:hypothetical protein
LHFSGIESTFRGEGGTGSCSELFYQAIEWARPRPGCKPHRKSATGLHKRFSIERALGRHGEANWIFLFPGAEEEKNSGPGP